MRPDIDRCNDIEILRQECRRLRSVIDEFVRDQKNATDLHEALKAENEKLREAVRDLNEDLTSAMFSLCEGRTSEEGPEKSAAQRVHAETISKCGGE